MVDQEPLQAPVAELHKEISNNELVRISSIHNNSFWVKFRVKFRHTSLLSNNEQDTSHKLHMWHDGISVGKLTLVSIILFDLLFGNE